MKILLAEDEPITLRSLQRKLEAWGHDVVAAEDGIVAWEHFQQQPFDIVVTDWDMPRLDGRELIQRFAWHFEPCDELGGDILNVLPLYDRYVVMYLLDVAGHGVPAALLSVTLSRVLTALEPSSSFIVAEAAGGDPPRIRSPRDVAERLNQAFPMDERHGRFFTLAYAVLDLETRKLQYMVAGHPPPVLLRKGRPPKYLDGRGFAVGIVDEPEYKDYSVQLEPGDRLFFYSDGVTEATNKAGAMLDTEGFVRMIEAYRDCPLEEGLVKCINDFRHWCDETPLADDISVLALEVSESLLASR